MPGSGCKHWYANLISVLQSQGLLRPFFQTRHLLTDYQLGITSETSASTDEDEDEDEDEETFRASSLGPNHNRTIIKLVEQTAVRAVMRRLNEGSMFEKKKCAEDMVRRINRNAIAKEHNAIMGDDTVKDMFEHLYGAIMRRQLPAAIWMALAPFCVSAHRSTRAFPESLILSTADSLADSWFFSSTFYRTSKNDEQLTDHEKEACESLSLFYNSGKVPRKSEAQIVAMVRKHSSNISKLFLSLAKKHPSFSAPIPTDHAFGVCWRGPLQSWTGSVSQKQHMHLMCSLYPGFQPARMRELSRAVTQCILSHPCSYWDTILTGSRNIMRGNFYFAQFCGTPPPKPEDMSIPYKLWGCITSHEAVTPPVRQDYETLAAKTKFGNMLISSAYTIVELLRESFGRKLPPLDPDDVDNVYKTWHKAGGLVDDRALSIAKKVLRVLRKPLENKKIIRFRGIFTREAYTKALYALQKTYSSHPRLFALVCILSRVIATGRNLTLANLLNHQNDRTLSKKEKNRCRDEDRETAKSLSQYM